MGLDQLPMGRSVYESIHMPSYSIRSAAWIEIDGNREGTDEDSHGQGDVEHNGDGRKRANGSSV